MRIAQVVPAITEEASGPSYSVVRLCESLIACGHEITLAALDWTSMTSPPSFLETFPLGMGPRRLGRSPAMLRWLRDQAKSRSIDLLHNHNLWMMPNVYPGRVARGAGIPLVVSPRGTLSTWAFGSGSWIKQLFWPTVQRPALAATSCFHATAESESEDIRRLGFRQPVAVIPNGIDIPEMTPKSSIDTRTLLFLGRIHPKKGLATLLAAWAAVQQRFPAWRLRIVGPDNRGHLALMRRLADELRLQRVEFADALYGQHKWQAYCQADLFVLPTHSENFGMAIAESLAAGTPAIVTKGAPWGGLVQRGAGWWIDIGVDPLVACLEDALAHSSYSLSEMGLRGRAWMQQDFSWSLMGKKMAATYAWILNGGEAPEWVRQV